MNLADLIHLLKEKGSSILVTGPQRSGTTIGARIIVAELGTEYEYIDEDEIVIDDVAAAKIVFSRPRKIVLQAPGLCYCAHTFDVPVVIMRRPIDQILASQERIKWGDAFEQYELRKYELTAGVISQVKYQRWDSGQAGQCVNGSFDLNYESLIGHSLWVENEKRKEFWARQWKREKDT